MKYYKVKCKNCKRTLPNDSFKTPNGCTWCGGMNLKTPHAFHKRIEKIQGTFILLLFGFGFLTAIVAELITFLKDRRKK
jgi:hypothetical protein